MKVEVVSVFAPNENVDAGAFTPKLKFEVGAAALPNENPVDAGLGAAGIDVLPKLKEGAGLSSFFSVEAGVEKLKGEAAGAGLSPPGVILDSEGKGTPLPMLNPAPSEEGAPKLKPALVAPGVLDGVPVAVAPPNDS